MSTAGRRFRLAFYGDDFTGSTDALEVLAFAGLRTALLLKPPTSEVLAAFPALDAIGVAGDSRAMTPAEMDRTLPPMFKALAECGAPIVHYKVCSTFDSSPRIGSIGHAMAIARPIFRNSFLPVVGSTPALQRYCLFGHLFARSGTDGRIYRLDRHPIMRVHPVTPAEDSDLALQLQQQSALNIAHLSFPSLEGGMVPASAALDDVLAQRPDAVLIDSASSHQLTTVGGLLAAEAERQMPLFVVGPSGVEYALTQWWREQGMFGRADPAYDSFDPVEQVLAISGSASPLSKQQIDAAIEAGFVSLAVDPLALMDEAGSSTAVQPLVASVLQALGAGHSVIVHTARGPDDVRIARTLDTLCGRGWSSERARHEGGRLLGQQLGAATREILQRGRVRRLLLSGGDTSSQITQVLAPDGLMVAARLVRGAPLCRMVAPSQPWLHGLEVALKGGQMGEADFFERARAGTRQTATA